METEKKLFLQIRDIKKNFGHVEALRGVDLDVYTREILAIVGDNGAGKSTLIKALAGVLAPDSGKIIVEGQAYDKLNPRQAMDLGISTVYQDLSLVNCRDIATNVFLGREPLKYGFFIDKKKMVQDSIALFQELKINIPSIYALVGQLSGGQRQGVAVAKAIKFGGKLLIFDEPTAAMGVQESAATLSLIKSLGRQGYAVIIISHNLHQVFSLAQRICMIRQGRVVDTVSTADVTPNQVVSLITGAAQELV
ncbi:MAG: Galactose/methyl galactoside import ATP-binding protein MglA [Pelotomaculum sp. PtaB.Bin104]|nr:MAG: Galactose/methyl galactoside import ATP-binding protein MglA [Pelotomaculum sp. PtaB.Bin104]